MSEEQTPVKLVIYTDGGCRPSRGIGGWSYHGYTYTDDVPKTGVGLKDFVPTALGYYPKHGKGVGTEAKGPEGIVPAVTPTEYFDGWGSLIPESTNNQAEIIAATKACQLVKKLDAKHVMFRVDSEYVKKGVTEWAVGWVERDWVTSTGQPVANRELWIELVALVDELTKQGVSLDWVWVKGHSDEPGNDAADLRATDGIIVGRKGIHHEHHGRKPAKGYWTPSTEVNRMFANSKWYFNTHLPATPRTVDGKYIYHLGEHGKEDDFLGKRMSDASFAVIYLKEPEPVLETVRQYQDHLDPMGFNSFVIGKLENIFKPDYYHSIAEFGTLPIWQKTSKHDIYIRDDPKAVQLTKDLRPPRLAFNMVDVLTTMERLLDSVRSGELGSMLVTDITEHLYDKEQTKKGETMKLKGHITSALKSLSLPLHYDTGASKGVVDTTLSIGIDTPNRNTLAALASKHPSVKVVSWKESPQAFRYATIVETQDDVGIWAGFYSNLRLITT